MSFLKKIFGDPNAKAIAEMQPLVDRVNELEAETKKLSNEDIRDLSKKFRDRLQKGESLDDILPEAFAAAREASRRTTGMRHFDVQLLGGIVLHRGGIAEMRTGEGKTLVATLPLYLNALSGKGAHLVTVNDYLARRDAVWMGQIYHALGLSVGVIQHMSAYVYDPHYRTGSAEENAAVHEDTPEDEERDRSGSFRVETSFLRPVSRQEAYNADITYGTNNEFGFDYLRDNMVQSLGDMVERDLNFAIVDEVDSILIDEARTPLIISAPAEESTDLYYRFAELVRRLDPQTDYTVDEKLRAAVYTEAGQEKIAKLLNSDPWASSDLRAVHHLEQALRAETLYKLDKEYVVREGEVIIVDEFTGRLMFGRRYSEGLHQAIEAKEGVKIQRESMTLATVTFQNYFRLYKKIAGMTGTAATEAEEFGKIYKLEVTSVPTNQPNQRRDSIDLVYKTERGKQRAAVADIKTRHEKGQPVLVGTISIEKNEILSRLLEQEGIPHEVLNAKNHAREAEIIAQAGRPGAVTVATNMAGRGVDIVLGGNPPDSENALRVKSLGGLHVIGTERHESRRIDNQLRGRCGRQGDPGSSQFFVSLEDDLMRIFAADRVSRVMETLRLPEDTPLESGMVTKLIESAQKKVEGHNFDIRKHLLEYDDVLNKHREAIYRRRREILEIGEGRRTDKSLREMILLMIEDEIEKLVRLHTSEEKGATWDIKEIYNVAEAIFPLPAGSREAVTTLPNKTGDRLEIAKIRTQVIEQLVGLSVAAYNGLEQRIGDRVLMRQIEKSLLLRSIDSLWIEHLDAMEHLRTGIGLRGYGQRDPLVEYKRDAYRMYQELVALIAKQVVYTIYRVGVAAESARSVMRSEGVRLQAPAKEGDSGAALEIEHSGEHHHKIGRNDPCPCGSGKKYKKCHGA
jgi:preprotein translocase subunit SecA